MKPAAEAAAKIACKWLAARGLHVEERIEEDPNGKKLNAWICVRRDSKDSCLTGPGRMLPTRMLPTWDWASQRKPREDAWLCVVEWLFLEGGDGPDTFSNVEMKEIAPGWTVEEDRRSPVPKFRFSTLEEFAVKAAAAGL